MDALINCTFRPWLSQEKLDIATETKRENFIYCDYKDLKTGKTRAAMFNKVTKEALWADSRPLISIKMLGVFAWVTPIATMIRLTGHLFKAVYTPLKIFFTAIKGFVEELTNGQFKEAFYDRLLVELVVGIVKEVVTRPLKILRLLAFVIPMELAAFIAVVASPDKGKRLYSLLESTLNYDEKREDLPKGLDGALELFNEKEVFWLAPCPHPWANLEKDTYLDEDGEEKPRYQLLSYSNELGDFSYENPCKNPPNYFCLPLLPCYD